MPLSDPVPNQEIELRPLFLATAMSFSLGQVVMLWYDLHYKTGHDTHSTIVALIISIILTFVLMIPRVTMEKVSPYVVGAVILVFLVELIDTFSARRIGTRIVVTYLMLVSTVFGIFDYKKAGIITLACFTLLASAFLGKQRPDLPLLMHVFCVSLMIATMSLQGISVRRQRSEVANYQRQAFTDALTGLPNRRSTWLKLERLDNEYRRERLPEEDVAQPYVIILIDLDHFKQVNDKYGHPTGDRVLQEVGSWLQVFANAHGGILGRWGGEEFLMVLPNTNRHVGYLLSDQLEQPILLSDGLPTITLSGGGVVSDECDSLNDLLSLADRRLYTAKQGGRCQIRWTRRMALDELNDDLMPKESR